MLKPNTESTRLRRGMRALVLAGLALAVLSSAGASAAADGAPGLAASDDSIDAACPCSGPAAGGAWRNHGQYLACVTRAARRQARTTHAVTGTARRMVRDRMPSSCGTTQPLEGNVRVCANNPVLACTTVRTARVDDCAECSAALAGELVRCARVETAGSQRDVCAGTTARPSPIAGRILEQRTGIDCASCTAKLGTTAPEGMDCVLAACGGGVSF